MTRSGTITTLSRREFNQRAVEAKKAANSNTVFITDRGRPAHVLMSFEEYQRLTKQRRNIADALAMPGAEDIGFEAPRLDIETRPADFVTFVLDTNVLSELRKIRLGRADTSLMAWSESVDAAVAQRCARLNVPDRRGERGALIAATALVHGMTVATRNVADFRPTEVPLVNPWEILQ